MHLAFALLSVLHISDVLSAGNFYLGTVQVPRDEAAQLCEDRSMELVTILDAEKNEAIFQLLNANGTDAAFWISGYKNSSEDIWYWLHGEEIKYTNWGTGEPNGYKEDRSCIEVFRRNSSAAWNDQPCKDQRGFICGPKKSTENFYLGTEKVSRDEASQLCEKRSMELVSIQTAEKNEAIFDLLQSNEINYAVWTSGNKNFEGKNWTWSDEEVIIYSNWGPGEPNGARGNENCIEVYKKNSTVFWNDHPCGDKRGYICEKISECETKLLTVTVDDKMCSRSTNASNTPSKKFYLSTERASRSQALKLCQDMYMQLASVRNKDENTVLFEMIRAKGTSLLPTPYWISGYKTPKGPWQWLDNKNITYFNWANGEPSYKGTSNICLEVALKNSLQWNDQYCSDQRFFVCEKLNPVVKITVKGNLTISYNLERSGESDCTVDINTK